MAISQSTASELPSASQFEGVQSSIKRSMEQMPGTDASKQAMNLLGAAEVIISNEVGDESSVTRVAILGMASDILTKLSLAIYIGDNIKATERRKVIAGNKKDFLSEFGELVKKYSTPPAQS